MQQTILRDPILQHQEMTIPGPQGTLLHVRLWGNLEHATTAIVAIHGVYQASYCWRHQKALATSGTVLIAFDLPFHGNTYTPAGVSLDPDLMAQSIRSIIHGLFLHETSLFLMGWSFGAWCIGTYLQRYGVDSIQGLILVSGLFGDMSQCLAFVEEEHREALEATHLLANPAATETSVMKATAQFVSHLRYTSYPVQEYPEAYAIELGYNLRAVTRIRVAQVNLLEQVAQNPLEGVYELLNEASLPICMMAGQQDSILPLDWLRLIAHQLSSVQVHEHDQCGHSFFAEYPEAFNNTVSSFLLAQKRA